MTDLTLECTLPEILAYHQHQGPLAFSLKLALSQSSHVQANLVLTPVPTGPLHLSGDIKVDHLALSSGPQGPPSPSHLGRPARGDALASTAAWDSRIVRAFDS